MLQEKKCVYRIENQTKRKLSVQWHNAKLEAAILKSLTLEFRSSKSIFYEWGCTCVCVQRHPTKLVFLGIEPYPFFIVPFFIFCKTFVFHAFIRVLDTLIMKYVIVWIFLSGYLVGKGGTLLPAGRWWSFLYASAINAANLLICLIGAKLFAKTTVFIFITTTLCIASSFFSFFSVPAMNVSKNTYDLKRFNWLCIMDAGAEVHHVASAIPHVHALHCLVFESTVWREYFVSICLFSFSGNYSRSEYLRPK